MKHTAVDGLDSNEYYTGGKKVSFYVSFEDDTSSELTPKPQKLCKEPVNLALVIGMMETEKTELRARALGGQTHTNL